MNRNVRIQVLAAATTLALAGGASAAGRVDLHRQDINQLNAQYKSAAAKNGIAAMAHTRHEQLLQLDAESYLVLKTRNSDNGVRNTRYQQTFRGLPVFGENVIVSEDGNGDVRTLFGHQITGLASEIASTQAKLTKGQALAKAKQLALGNRATMGTRNEKVTLTIFVDDSGRAHLAYHIDFLGADAAGPTRPSVIIDANTGNLLQKWENLQTELVGTGPGGNGKTGQYEYGTNYGFLDVTKTGTTCVMDNVNVTTYNVKNRYWDAYNGVPAPTDLEIHSFQCPRNTVKAINGGFAPMNDAHYFGGVIFDMYRDWMNSAPLTFKLKMRVHFGTSHENAFWDGEAMTFGDGATNFYPLVSLDVSSHEVSHGYTEQQSGLAYTNQPGGLNEAYSDIAGEAAEFYMKGQADFLVGGDITKGAGALRYMCNPTQDGRSIANAANYTAGMDPHFSSGVYNKAFCNLAKTNGWDVKKAFQAFAVANRDYWSPSTTFDQGAVGVLRAACDLGLNGQNVKDAFTTVGVNAGVVPAGCGGGTPPANTAPVANFTSSVSGLTATFTDSSTDSDGSIASRSWNFGDGTTSAATSPSKTYTAAGTYSVSLTVTDNLGATNTKTASVTVVAAPTGGSALTNGVAKTGLSGVTGSKQYFTLVVPAGATNLKFVTTAGTGGDLDLYVKFGSQPTTSVYDCVSGGYSSAETCSIAVAQAGTYHVLLDGYSAYSGVSLTGSYTASGGGGGAQTYSNTTDYNIPDYNLAGIESPITVSGRSGNAPSNASVTVAIKHPYRGDLQIDLIAPDGSAYRLKSIGYDSADDVNATYVVNLSTEALNGTWKLRVSDQGPTDVGNIDSWSVTF